MDGNNAYDPEDQINLAFSGQGGLGGSPTTYGSGTFSQVGSADVTVLTDIFWDPVRSPYARNGDNPDWYTGQQPYVNPLVAVGLCCVQTASFATFTMQA